MFRNTHSTWYGDNAERIFVWMTRNLNSSMCLLLEHEQNKTYVQKEQKGYQVLPSDSLTLKFLWKQCTYSMMETQTIIFWDQKTHFQFVVDFAFVIHAFIHSYASSIHFSILFESIMKNRCFRIFSLRTQLQEKISKYWIRYKRPKFAVEKDREALWNRKTKFDSRLKQSF